jgi:hypothetical protein
MLALIGGMSWQMLWGNAGSQSSSATISDGFAESEEPSPSTAPSRVPKTVSTDAIVALAPGARGDTLRYYEAKTGRAFAYHPASARTETLSETTLKGFSDAYWLPGADRVIGVFDEKGTLKYRWYDFATGEYSEIGTAVAALAVAPDGKRVAYTEPSDGAVSLFIADATGASPDIVLKTRASSARLSWSSRSDSVVMASRRTDRAGWDLTAVGLTGEITPILTNKENLEYLWAPDGRSFIYSYFVPDQGIELFWHNPATGDDLPLSVATSARKCAWLPTGDGLVCGIPSKTALSRDVPADRMATTDDLVRVALFGASTVLYKVPAQTLLGIIDPVITPSGDFFAFQNLFDQRLYTYDLR